MEKFYNTKKNTPQNNSPENSLSLRSLSGKALGWLERKERHDYLRDQEKREQTLTQGDLRYVQQISDEEWFNLPQTILNTFPSPAEASQIRKSDTIKESVALQLEKLKNIKETIAWFRFELGRAEKRISKRVLDDTPKSLEGLYEICNQELKELPISPELSEKIKKVCEKFFVRNKKIQEMREEFPDDAELFKQITKQDPVGEIEIITTPISFYIRAHSLEDYAKIYHLKSYNNLIATQPVAGIFSKANESLGVMISTAYEPQLNGAITAENTALVNSTENSKSVFIHETQHSLYRFFYEEFNAALANDYFQKEISTLTKDTISEYTRIYTRLLRTRREKIEARAKDEIFAFLIEGAKKLFTIENTLLKSNNYNYYADTNKELLLAIPEISMFSIKKPFEFKDSEVMNDRLDYDPRVKTVATIKEGFEKIKDSVAEKVFVDEYKKIIHLALVSIQVLRKQGFDDELIINILTHEPLTKWPSLAKKFKIDYTEKPAK